MILNWIRRKTWKPKGKIYSLKCNQCGDGFISNHPMEAPICGICLQKVKSIDLTVDTEKKCIICGRNGVFILLINVMIVISKNKLLTISY